MTTEVARQTPSMWWLVLLQGIAALILGVLLLTTPGTTTVALVTFLGIYWLVSGIFSIIGIFVGDGRTHWGWLLFSGILGILAGLAVLNHPLMSGILIPTFIVIFLGIDGLIMGIISVIQGFKGGGAWAFVLGALSIIFGLILLGSPFVAATVLPFVLGIFGIMGGISLIVLAFQVRSVEREALAA